MIVREGRIKKSMGRIFEGSFFPSLEISVNPTLASEILVVMF